MADVAHPGQDPRVGGRIVVWRRALRNSILAIKDPIRRGCARCLPGSALWPPARKKAVGLRRCDVCELWLKGVPGTLEHQLYDCGGLLQVPDELDVETLLAELLGHRELLPGLGVTDLGRLIVIL